MVAMPYLVLGTLGFLFYRSCKRAQRQAALAGAAVLPGDS